MVQVDVEILNIESDPTGQMITLTVEVNIEGITEKIRFGEMVGNLRGKTEPEIRQHFKGILQDVIRQKIGEREELTPDRKWKRAQKYIGATFTVEVE